MSSKLGAIQISDAMAHDLAAVYIKQIQSFSLGAATEYRVVNVIVPSVDSDPDRLISKLQQVCFEFPREGKYVVMIFDSDKAAAAQIAKPMAGLNIAEINAKDELILFPFDSQKRRVVKIDHDWCKERKPQQLKP